MFTDYIYFPNINPSFDRQSLSEIHSYLESEGCPSKKVNKVNGDGWQGVLLDINQREPFHVASTRLYSISVYLAGCKILLIQ